MKLLFYNWKTFVFANKNCKLLYVNCLFLIYLDTFFVYKRNQ